MQQCNMLAVTSQRWICASVTKDVGSGWHGPLALADHVPLQTDHFHDYFRECLCLFSRLARSDGGRLDLLFLSVLLKRGP